MSDLKTNLEEILQEKETKIIPANIKKDVQIFDVVGTYEGEEGIDTSDANATADDIIDGKTAYVNGQKIIGSITDVSGTFALASIPITSVLYESTSITGEEKDIVFLSNFFENSIDTNRFCLATQYPIHMYLGEDKYSDLAEIITLTPDKLKKDETILGVTGTYEGEGGDDVSNYINMTPTETTVKFSDLITKIPELNTSNVTNMTSTFNGYHNLIEISPLNTSNVTNMTSMFASCTSLTSIPLLDTSSVTNMSYMFQNCSNLITIPLLDTSSVTNMNQMFRDAKNLTEIPQLNTSSVIYMSYIFSGCSKLTTVPQLNMSSITSMSNIFDGCYDLSDDSLNNILASLLTATSYTGTKTLDYIGLTSDQATTCATLSNWAACEEAGWTTGY